MASVIFNVTYDGMGDLEITVSAGKSIVFKAV